LNLEAAQDLKRREEQKAAHLLKSGKTSPRDFFPDLRLGETYGYYIFRKPLWLLVPFYDTIIVNLPPLKDKSAFERILGLTLEDAVALQKKSRVQFTLDYEPTRYVGLDYLDPIIEYAPCHEIRLDALCKATRMKYDEYLKEGTRMFDGRLGDLARQFKWEEYVLDARKELEVSAASLFAELKCLGYDGLASRISNLAHYNAQLAYRCLYVYSSFLTDPVFRSLDGINPIESEFLQLKTLYEELINCPLYADKEVLYFPEDVGRALIKELRLDLPQDLDQALKASTGKARKALKELDETVKRMQSEKILDRSFALETALMEANEAIRSLQLHQVKLRETTFRLAAAFRLAKITIGLTGIATGALTGDPLLTCMLASTGIAIDALRHFVEPTVKRVLRIPHKSHVVSLYDFRVKEAGSTSTYSGTGFYCCSAMSIA